MNYLPDDPVEEWQLSVERWMLRTALNSEDPEADVRDWFDEAADGDDQELRWAILTWHGIRNEASLDLERRLRSVEAALGKVRSSGNP